MMGKEYKLNWREKHKTLCASEVIIEINAWWIKNICASKLPMLCGSGR